MARNYAALLHEYLEEMSLYSDEEFGRLCRALLRYSMSGEAQELAGAEKFAWQRVKTQEDRFQSSYEDMAAKRREAGKNGAAKRWDGKNSNAIDAMANDSKNSKTETKTKTETNIPLPTEGGNKRKKFAPPTLEQVAEYVAQRGSPVDPQGFIDFYESKGWMVGKTPMKDWKAACRNAEGWDRWKSAGKDGSSYRYMPGTGKSEYSSQTTSPRLEEMRQLEKTLERIRGGRDV